MKMLPMMTAGVFLFSMNAMADLCQMPQASVYSAQLAQSIIKVIHSALPNVQFDPTFSVIDGTHDVNMRTLDGTQLVVSGYFAIVPLDVLDSEGNITGCSLWAAPYNSNVNLPTIDSVTNTLSSHNILHSEASFEPNSSSSGAVLLGITYPYVR